MPHQNFIRNNSFFIYSVVLIIYFSCNLTISTSYFRIIITFILILVMVGLYHYSIGQDFFGGSGIIGIFVNVTMYVIMLSAQKIENQVYTMKNQIVFLY